MGGRLVSQTTVAQGRSRHWHCWAWFEAGTSFPQSLYGGTIYHCSVYVRLKVRRWFFLCCSVSFLILVCIFLLSFPLNLRERTRAVVQPEPARSPWHATALSLSLASSKKDNNQNLRSHERAAYFASGRFSTRRTWEEGVSPS